MIRIQRTTEFCPLGQQVLTEVRGEPYEQELTDPEEICVQKLRRLNLNCGELIIRSRRHSESGGVEELLADDRVCVVVRNNSKLVATYKTNFRIVNAFWQPMQCDNPETKYTDVLCLLGTKKMLFCVAPDKVFPLNLPFPIENAIPTNAGIILQRFLSNPGQYSEKDNIPPKILSLNNPFGDVVAVIYLRPGKDNQLCPRFITTPCLSVVFVSCDVNVALTFDRRSQTHSLWRIRRATTADTERALQLMSDSIYSMYELSMALRTPSLSTGRQASADRPTTSALTSESSKPISGFSAFSSQKLSTGATATVSSGLLTAGVSGTSGTKPSTITGSSVLSHSSHRQLNISPMAWPLSRIRSPKMSTPLNLCNSALPKIINLSSKGSSYLSPFVSAASLSQSSGQHCPLSVGGAQSQTEGTITAFDQEAMFSAQGELPNIALDPLWTEPNIIPNSLAKRQAFAAHKAFVTRDFVSRVYFCYIAMPTSTLKCIQLQCDNKKDPVRTVGQLHTVTICHDAEGSIGANVMIVLDLSYNVLIYSGLSQLGILHLTGELTIVRPSEVSRENESRTHVERIFCSSRRQAAPSATTFDSRDLSAEVDATPGQSSSIKLTSMGSEMRPVTPAVANIICSLDSGSSAAFILNLVSGRSLKLHLLPLISSSLTQCVVRALKNVLPEELIFDFLVKWYLEAQTYSHHLVQLELPRFLRCLMEALGFDTSQIVVFNESCEQSSVSEQGERKKRKSSKESSDAAWNKLLSCDFTRRYGLLPELLTSSMDCDIDNDPLEEVAVRSEAPLFPYISSVYFALYCCYEDLKISGQSQESISAMGCMLMHLAGALKLHCHKERYLRELGQYSSTGKTVFTIRPIHLGKLRLGYEYANCLGIYELVSCFLRHGPEFGLPIAVVVSCERLLLVLLLFLVISGEWQAGMSFDLCIELIGQPSDFTNNMKRMFNSCKPKSTTKLIESMLQLMPDFYNTLPSGLLFIIINYLYDAKDKQLFPFLLPFTRPYLGCMQQQRILDVAEWANAMFCINNPDGMEEAIRDPLLRRRFGNDHVLREIRHFFGTCSPCKLEPLRSRGHQQPENTELHERSLIKTLLRKLATPIARGMFTLRSVHPGCTEHLAIPKLCLCGVVLPKNLLVHAKRMELFPNILYWPRFHNGVAAALSIQPLKKMDKSREDPLDKSFIGSWLSHNLPYTKEEGGTLSPEHGGLMFGLGLNGYLRRLSLPEYHKYLIQCDPMVTSGLLLGIAAGMVGTCDLKIMKVLAPHVPFLTPPTLLDLCIEPTIQTTAVFAVGLLCAQSADLKLCICFLEQIENPSWAARDNVSEREGYALTCGLAFGLVALGRGRKLFSLPGRNFLLDRIVRMIHGGRSTRKEQEMNKEQEESLVKESRFYNTHVTAAPGILALGMSFLRSRDAGIAEWLKLPHRLEDLQCIRPDAAMLRVLSYSLIMWDIIGSDYRWIDALLPIPLRNYGRSIPAKKWDNLDGETLGQIYCYAVSGAAFAMALRFVSTGCARVIKTLWNLFRLFFLKEHDNKGAVHLIEISGRYTDEICSAVVLLSLALVTAGSGHPDVLCAARAHLVRYSGRTEGAFGSQLVSHMAIGLALLGAGNYAFKVDDISIACLICALYPRFPMFHRDNRHHAQILRHLYVLAAERRSLEVQDSTTGSPVKATITWEFRDGVFDPSDEAEKTLIPFGSDWNMLPLPDLNILKSVHVSHRHYWSVDFRHDDPKSWAKLKKLLENGESLNLCPKNLGLAKEFEMRSNCSEGVEQAETSPLLWCVRNTASTEALSVVDSLLGIKQKPRLTYADVWQLKLVEEYFQWRHGINELLNRDSLVSDAVADHMGEWLKNLLFENVSADELRLYLTEGKRKMKKTLNKVGLDELLTYYAIPCPVDAAAQIDGFESIATASMDEMLLRTSVVARARVALLS